MERFAPLPVEHRKVHEMKDSHTPYTPAIIRLILAIVLSLVSLCAVAQQGQGQDVNAKSDQPASSSTTGPVTANTQEPSTAAPAASPATGSPTGQQLARTPKNSQDDDKLKGHSIEAVVIAGLMIVVLGSLFVWQILWSHKLEQTSYLGQLFHDSMLEFEHSRLTAHFRDDWDKGIYLQDAVMNTPPPKLEPDLAELDRTYGYGDLRWERERIMKQMLGMAKEGYRTPPLGLGLLDNRRPTGSTPVPKSNVASADNQEPAETQKEDPKETEYKKRAQAFLDQLKDWEEQIRKVAYQKYEDDLKEAKEVAKANTETVINRTETSALRGQGPKFILEFTALIVIIFLAVILGVLGRLDSQQIGTLLAAIAGYVLGKATTSQAPTQISAQVPASSAPKAEDQGRASGRAA